MLQKLLSSQSCRLIIRNLDKYGGRVLGEFYLENKSNVTDIMIEKGYGRIYNGEKKTEWTDQELDKILNLHT